MYLDFNINNRRESKNQQTNTKYDQYCYDRSVKKVTIAVLFELRKNVHTMML